MKTKYFKIRPETEKDLLEEIRYATNSCSRRRTFEDRESIEDGAVRCMVAALRYYFKMIRVDSDSIDRDIYSRVLEEISYDSQPLIKPGPTHLFRASDSFDPHFYPLELLQSLYNNWRDEIYEMATYARRNNWGFFSSSWKNRIRQIISTRGRVAMTQEEQAVIAPLQYEDDE